MRTLASDARAGSWARGKARTTQRAFVRANWRPYTAFLVGLLIITLVVAWLMPTDLLRGLTSGAMLVAGPAILWSWTVQVTGTAPTMMGDVAEQWTAAELRKLRARGWRMVNHFVLSRGDMDHVLVGPGGTFVVETKWTATAWRSDFGQARIRDAVAQASANARDLRLWHRLKSRNVEVEAVVVLWGGGVKDWADGDRIGCWDGTAVVAGPALMAWASDLPETALGADDIAEVWAALDAQVTRRDPIEEQQHPVPLSLTEIATRIGVGTTCVILGFLFVGEALRLTGSAGLAVLVGLGSVVPAVILRRSAVARSASSGWLVGVGLPIVVLSVAEIAYRLPL